MTLVGYLPKTTKILLINCSLTTTLGILPAIVSSLQILAYPYIQPGNTPGLTKDEYVIKWITDDEDANFKVLFGKKRQLLREIPYEFKKVDLNSSTRHYRAVLTDLDLDTKYTYRVYKAEKLELIRESNFPTKTKGSKFTFVATGCGGEDTAAQSNICERIKKAKPRFVMHLGDVSYPHGLMREYYTNVFPYYNKPDHIKDKGASLMSRIPFYLTYGNHDVSDGLGFTKDPDNLASFYVFEHPNNGPRLPKNIPGPQEQVENFKNNLNSIHETATNYSFDYGNIHFIILDGNTWVNPDDPNLRNWVENDLRTSKAPWKIACIHQPPFCAVLQQAELMGNAGTSLKEDRERSRKLVDLFQKGNVDIVLSAHVHNYQRSKPIFHDPVTQAICIDRVFNGHDKTTPEGIVYFVTGAGGAHLHLSEFAKEIKKGRSVPKGLGFISYLPESTISSSLVAFLFDPVAHLAKAEYYKHSFTQFDVNGGSLDIKQIDLSGNVIDQISITKNIPTKKPKDTRKDLDKILEMEEGEKERIYDSYVSLIEDYRIPKEFRIELVIAMSKVEDEQQRTTLLEKFSKLYHTGPLDPLELGRNAELVDSKWILTSCNLPIRFNSFKNIPIKKVITYPKSHLSLMQLSHPLLDTPARQRYYSTTAKEPPIWNTQVNIGDFEYVSQYENDLVLFGIKMWDYQNFNSRELIPKVQNWINYYIIADATSN